MPTPVEVQWNSGSITSGIKNFPAVLGKSGTYFSACESKTSPPTVKVMQASCGENGSVDLVCLVNKYSPRDIKIQWLLNGEKTSIVPSNSTPYKDDDGTFGTFSKVSVPKEDWITGDSYTCKVHHAASETKEEDTIKKCQESVVPKVVILPPTPKDLFVTKQPKVTCVVSQMESTESLEIKWKREDGKKALAFPTEPEIDYTGRYIVKSTLKLSLADWTDGKTFTCIVQHSDLPNSVEKSIKKTQVETIDPSVYVFPPPTEELALYDFATLICFVKSFKPKDMYIQWLKNGIALDEEYYTNTNPILQEEEETYYLYSTLTIEKSDWNRGVTWTCNSVHSKITSKDIKKSRGK
ncbi:hypothetical protein GDO78_007050 [Eleutherodactylus coqui]|uniref:Ig-like domain-containing protein n=1 Tax=Eleutherodactylus coqui TaxID=57060 RepID=A0A8J6KCU2_ELECQ|nr:hypothetical protein GDO78_007050 [Eleutherodactylus coqui]